MKPLRALDLIESLEIAEKNGFPVEKFRVIKKKEEILLDGKSVMKAVSKKALHKTEFNAVKLGIQSQNEAVNAFLELSKIPGFEGALLQKQLKGTELIIGSKRDPVFGPIVLAGIGGIFTEILGDVSIRISPVSLNEAREMFSELKAHKILEGYRSMPAVNLKKACRIIVKLSELLEKNPEIQELEFNPVICNEKDCRIVDARGVLV